MSLDDKDEFKFIPLPYHDLRPFCQLVHRLIENNDPNRPPLTEREVEEFQKIELSLMLIVHSLTDRNLI